MEIITALPMNRPSIKAALFDFDGTISTLRYGWESVMEPLMIEMIAGTSTTDDSLIRKVRKYIDESTGIQTIYQMEWLTETLKQYGNNPDASSDPWWYKQEYNTRLMQLVDKRISDLKSGKESPYNFLMKGSIDLLKTLHEQGIHIYVASGTDDSDVKNEAEILGVKKYFKEIAGAPIGKKDCSKEGTLRRLIAENSLRGIEVVVIGDGKVEIALGREMGTVTLGLASDEDKRYGVNEIKRKRLIAAGAHAVLGDFENLKEILDWLNLNLEIRYG